MFRLDVGLYTRGGAFAASGCMEGRLAVEVQGSTGVLNRSHRGRARRARSRWRGRGLRQTSRETTSQACLNAAWRRDIAVWLIWLHDGVDTRVARRRVRRIAGDACWLHAVGVNRSADRPGMRSAQGRDAGRSPTAQPCFAGSRRSPSARCAAARRARGRRRPTHSRSRLARDGEVVTPAIVTHAGRRCCGSRTCGSCADSTPRYAQRQRRWCPRSSSMIRALPMQARPPRATAGRPRAPTAREPVLPIAMYAVLAGATPMGTITVLPPGAARARSGPR